MTNAQHTPGPLAVFEWHGGASIGTAKTQAGVNGFVCAIPPTDYRRASAKASARLLAAAYTSYDKHFGPNAIAAAEADLLGEALEVVKEGRRAIGDHFAPSDCYATGPVTGDAYRDLVQCPACSFIAMHDALLTKAGKDGQ